MTYYGGHELARSFRTVRGNTIQIAEDIPEAEYGFIAAPEVLSVEKLFLHIALSYRFQHRIQAVEQRSSLEGFDFPAMMQKLAEEEAKPRTKVEVLGLLRSEGEIWATFLDGLSEDYLGEPVTMPAGSTPASKSRFEMILSVKEHEMHHRAQLMLIERLIGIVPHLTRARQERMAQARA